MELLVELHDKEAPSVIKRGDVVAVCPDGWIWSERERNSKQWRIVKTGELLDTHHRTLLAVPRSASFRGHEHFRAWGVDLDQLPASGFVSVAAMRTATYKRPITPDWVPAEVPPITTFGVALAMAGIGASKKTRRRDFLRGVLALWFLMALTVRKAWAGTITDTIGSGGGRTYSTIQAWINAIPGALTTDSYVGQCFNDSEFSVAGTVANFGAHTGMDATHTITLTTGTGQSFQDNASVRTNALEYNQSNGVGLKNTGSYVPCILCSGQSNFLTVSKLQAICTGASGATEAYADTAAGNTNGILKDCILTTTASTSRVVEFSGTFGINLLIVNLGTGGSGARNAINNATWIGCTDVRPSTRTAAGTGFGRTYGTPILKSCASFGFTTANSGGWSASSANNATDQATMTAGSGNQTSVTYSGVTPFTDAAAAGLDWSAIAATALAANGVRDATNAPNDITGYPRASSPTIGCWELTASATTRIMRRFVGE